MLLSYKQASYTGVRQCPSPQLQPWPLSRQAHVPKRRRTCIFTPAAAATQNIAKLQQEYGIAEHVQVVEGQGGLPKVVLSHSSGTKAEVYLYGGLVLSWKQPSGDEVLFTRPDAVFDKSKPISGGIPHCFPQFGPGKIQQHGFARNCDWEIASTSADLQPDERDPEVELVLTDSDFTRSIWPHPFKAAYSVSLHGDSLRTDLRIINTGDQAFDFTAALHSYFEVLDISKARIRGLKGLQYLDKTPDPNNPVEKKEEREVVSIDGPMDAVFLSPGDYVELDVGTGAAVSISSSGWEDVVVWNPWDAMPASYEKFCCVENGKIAKPVVLQPGSSWRATQELNVIILDTPDFVED
ncbi:hypothetical protein WJX73_009431 [Symbiochloris irregularis]|uniref:glucose-6-phosphate 1-epimerase n=1 Tax=Symbiochloris irregularis TaxID=706552 RepID=A0AAW1P6A1_9CHLO